MTTSDNREEWLQQAGVQLTRWVKKAGGPAFPPPLVSVGWPRGSRGKSHAIGQCWDKSASGESNEISARAHVFISPELTEAESVLAVLLHELVHASVGTACGHRGEFRKVAIGTGLEGKMTATVAGAALSKRLGALAGVLGKYPHPGLNESSRKKPGSRLLKVLCGDCGCIVRITRTWLDSVGPPQCGCGAQMEESY